MSKPTPLIVLAGGSGFIGRHLAPQLATHGWRIRVLTRDAARVRDLRVLPTLEVRAHPAIYHPDLIRSALTGAHTVVNLVGTLHEGIRRDRRFEWTHVGITESLLASAEATGVRHFIQVSALGADGDPGRSRYLASKARAAHRVRSSGLDWALVQPSVIYGPDDDFLQRFAKLLRVSPGLFPLTCPDTPMAPVDIADVARALMALIGQSHLACTTYPLGGPQTSTLREIVATIAEGIGTPRVIVGLPDWMSWLTGALLGNLPHPPFTLDNYRTLKAQAALYRSLEGGPTRGFERLGIVPQPFTGRSAIYLEAYAQARNGGSGPVPWISTGPS